jgi:predicted extracellular nuclease
MYQDRRREQARFNADIVKYLMDRVPGARVIVAGDMNADYNTPEHHSQLSALNRMTREDRRSATVLDNLTSRLGNRHRHSYDYRNKNQLLDWMFVSNNLSRQLIELRVPHVNSQAPDKDSRGSDHDPVVARFRAFGQ